jgi:hypothetical protein
MRILKLFLAVIAVITMNSASAQTTVLTEDFSGDTNIFGVSTATSITAGMPCVYDSKLTGFGPVLAVCKATAEGTISVDGLPVAISDGTKVTAEWDAFHGYYGNNNTSTVSLLNSEGKVLASYVYNAKDCKVTKVTIGEQDVPGFEAFGLQAQNGFGGNGKPYAATGNPHIAITITARGGVTMVFNKGTSEVKKMLGSVGEQKKDIAKMRIVSSIDNTDRCYAVDNIKVTTDVLEEDPNYVEGIANVIITGADKLTFGPSPDEAFSNPYSIIITGTDGTTITEKTISAKVTDFNVVWDIDGFKTQNDTEGQYCDSYGAFSVNNTGAVNTTFDLRDVPMNFFGRMTATITYNGTTTKAEKYVVALGNTTTVADHILPLGGYPSNLSEYPDALKGYKVTGETYGSSNDLILGGWCVAGSDSHNAQLSGDTNGTKYVRLTASTAKKSHVLTQKIESPTGQFIFKTRLRFNNAGALVTLTGGNPFWSSSRYTCPVTLNYDGTNITLNGTALKSGENDAQFTTGTWYDIVLSADKSSERCYALIYSVDGQLLAESGILPWAETSSPNFFSVGMGNNNTGSVDMAVYEAYVPQPTQFTLVADKTTLSIPNKETATLTATVTDQNGCPITGQATWTVVEEDMQQGIVITPDENNSQKAVITLAETAEAGTATIQVNIGGETKTIELSLTSSAESIKFTQSTTSITIPLDAEETVTATFAAILIDGDGNNLGTTVTLAAYDKENDTPFVNTEAISFDATTGVLSVKATASPVQLTIRATGNNSDGQELTKSLRVNIHGMKFDFGFADDEAVAEGFTLVSPSTTYNNLNGYGIKSGTPTAVGTVSAIDATTDYLEGALEFDFKVQKGEYYLVEITYQGTLTTGYINSDLAGYELGSSDVMTTQTYTIPATVDIIDLRISGTNARIAQISITKQAKRQKRGKRVVHHIGDSTSANNGSWAYRLKNTISNYPELSALCDFHNDGAGGRNLSTYYTQGKLAGVLRDIYPGDVVMFGNNGTNGMGSSFEDDVNYYLDAAEILGAQVIINSYTPHGAVSNYASGYDASTCTFDSYRRDSYDIIVRKVADQRAKNDENYLGFVEIGKNADAIFNAYVSDYAVGGYISADAAAQAIISCFGDHNHYSNGPLACQLMLNGYSTTATPGIVSQLVSLLNEHQSTAISQPASLRVQSQDTAVYNLNGQRVTTPVKGLYIKNGKKMVIK